MKLFWENNQEQSSATAGKRTLVEEDGQNVDIGLTVKAAEQLEEVVGPDEEDELPAGSPAEEGQSAPSAPQPPPFRGAGWSSPMQALPHEPMSPFGLGSGGKREAPPVQAEGAGHLADRSSGRPSRSGETPRSTTPQPCNGYPM